MKLIFRILIIVIILFLDSCAVYTPQVTPPILIEEKNEMQTDIGGSFSSFYITPGMYASIAYGLTDYLAIQSFGSIISSGTYHFEESLGLNKKINDKIKISLLTGYFYGVGTVLDKTHMSIGPIKWEGHYQSPFVRFQFSNKFKKLYWGFGLKAGYFNPEYYKTREYDYHSIIVHETTLINQKGLLIEPSLFFNIRIKDKFGIIFNLADSWIKPLDQFNECCPNSYEIKYDYYGNIGIGIYYKFNWAQQK